MHISDEHVEHWRRHGYVIAPLLSPEEVEAVRSNALRYFPDWEEWSQGRKRYESLALQREFPFVDDALNDVATHPDLVSFMERALGTADLQVTQSLVWAKYPGYGDGEQALHIDYFNNSLTYPSDVEPFGQVPSILYLEDMTETIGPTWAVSREHTRQRTLVPPALVRDEHPEVYAHEFPVLAKAGEIFLYDMRTYHRGSAFTAKEGWRLTFHNVYRKAGCEWMGWRAFPQQGLDPAMSRFLQRATVRQRTVIGFPAPGHAYWTEQTLAGVAARYPEMDMAPYREAMAQRAQRAQSERTPAATAAR
jgi:hypothetical protein